MELESTHGSMAELMKDHGKIIICMGREFIHGAMGENMMESTTWIRNMALVSTIGLMAGGTRVIGQTENNMEKENTFYQMVLLRLVSGKMERE
jgi:hypothetical protein